MSIAEGAFAVADKLNIIPGLESIRFVTLTEFMKLYGKSQSTVYRWIEKGWLPEPEIGPGGHHGWWLDKLQRHMRKSTKPLDKNRERKMRGPAKDRNEERQCERLAEPEYQDWLAEDDPEFAEVLKEYRAQRLQTRVRLGIPTEC
jgi:predicted DNA-binding transcriptional regulator AlpA